MLRKANMKDLPALQEVYRAAKKTMAETGNPTQWPEDYPECVLEMDIINGVLYVLCGEDGLVHAAFSFILGDDPTYSVIEDGTWGSDAPYGTIHRLGSDGELKGVFSTCLNFCKDIIPHIRADTHHDNLIMQHLLKQAGFIRRGNIHTEDGTLRIAYEFMTQ